MLAMQFKTKLTSTIIIKTLIIINKNNNNTRDECLPERIDVGHLHPFRKLQPHCEESAFFVPLFCPKLGQKTGIRHAFSQFDITHKVEDQNLCLMRKTNLLILMYIFVIWTEWRMANNVRVET